MKSKFELKNFTDLAKAQDFINTFEKEIIKIDFIPLHTPSFGIKKMSYFIAIEYVN